jgi:Restriction endonuclease AspBHI N-terminal
MAERIPFEQLEHSDLVVNAIYEGGTKGNASDDALAKLLKVGNQGGFRIHGKWKAHEFRYAVLYTSGAETDWPDRLDVNTGLFTYYGDNRKPGKPLHQTSRRGNEMLRLVFEAIHAPTPQRQLVPPFFVFGKVGRGRDRQFLGLAVPGAADVAPTDDLVAVWRTTTGERFQKLQGGPHGSERR